MSLYQFDAWSFAGIWWIWWVVDVFLIRKAAFKVNKKLAKNIVKIISKSRNQMDIHEYKKAG